MDEFRRRPVNRVRPMQAPVPVQASREAQSQAPIPQLTLEAHEPRLLPPPKKKKKALRVVLWIISVLLALSIIGVLVVWFWYQGQLTPVDPSRTEKVAVEIVSGSSPIQIAKTLKEHDVIRSESAFLWYTRINKVQNNLQAGMYRLSPSESTAEIVEHLKKGKVDTFSITFLPGSTLAENKKVFINAGYSEKEVTEGLSATYTSPLFAGKPASADLEGYIYGETYTFGVGASVKDILTYVFDFYYKKIEQNNLEAQFKAQGLSLYEGITLASIIQRESIGGDEAQIAQVFYTRIAMGMQLGSDVTYQYIADKLGVPRDTNLDSPYNTRRYTGLPPGPIAVPGLNALKAVGAPAEGDYIYFLSGDDDVTYFGRTLQEHEANIVNHCRVKCQII